MAISLTGVQHIGVPVSDLARSLRFYEDIFGVTPSFTDSIDDPAVSTHVGIPGAKIDVAFVRIGNTYLELLQYTHPRGAAYDRRNCDIGAIHVCFEVEDIRAAWDVLKAKGVDIAGEPHTIEDGQLAGYSFGYFKDPDGIQLEFFEPPKGRPNAVRRTESPS